MNGSKIRVLALDLDGTLTNDEKIVTPRTRDGAWTQQRRRA